MKVNKNMEMAVNAVGSEIRGIRGELNSLISDPKHDNFYQEMGMKKELSFQDLFDLYDREGVAYGAINQLSDKCFETAPTIKNSGDEAAEESQVDREIKAFAKSTRLWNKFKEVDKRRMVGEYSCLIMQIKDDKNWAEPAENVKPEDVIGFIPVWQKNITVSQYDVNTFSPMYGMPLIYSFNEFDFNSKSTQNPLPGRNVSIHYTRVILLGDTYYGRSMLASGYNAARSLEKVTLAGGEGVYKNASSRINMNFSKDVDLNKIAKLYGVKLEELSDIVNEQIQDLNASFDSAIITQDAATNILSVTLPDTRDNFDNPLAVFAASIQIPSTIIIGMQTGERASSEDQKQFNKRCTSRRNVELTPDIENMFLHFQSLGMWQGQDINVHWDSLLDASDAEKLDNAKKMSDINKNQLATGQVTFSDEEIRVAAGLTAEPEGDVNVEGEAEEE